MKNKLLHSFRLRATMLVAMMLCVVNAAWADVESGTTYSTAATGSLPTGWTGSDGDGTSYIKLIDSGHYIQTSNFAQNGFTSITVKARKFGGPSDAQALITVSWYDASTSAETVLGTVAPTNTTLTNYPISSPTNPTGNTTGYVKIQCKGASSSKGSGVSEVTITYTAAGGTPTPTTYTVTYDANGGTGTMTDDDSPYEADDEVTLLTNTFTAPEGKLWSSWSVKDASDNDITVSNGKFTMPASNVTVSAQWADDPNAPQYEWVETNLADLTSTDIFVIVGSGYAMTNNNGTSSAPAATAVSIVNGKITSTVAENIKWNISRNGTDGYTFYPNGSTTTWLYCNTTAATSNNNNMRVGTGDRKLFLPDNNGYFVTNDNSTDRYISLYNNTDWRGYVNTNSAVALKFYKRQVASTDPSISASDVNIAYGATSGSFDYTINNPVQQGGTVSIDFDSEGDWLLTATDNNDGTISFTCEANENTTERQALVVITYTYNTNETVTKNVWVTQAAAPVVYSTIPTLFAAATGTETEVKVTFNNWVVSGVSTNGKNVFVTDNNGNGFVIYSSTDISSTYPVGSILSGTAVTCNLVLYNGFAEIKNLNASDLTITTGGTVTAANVAMADLAGVNTGALVSYENLTCTVDNYLSDGTTTLQVYNALFAFDALEAGKTYNITGIYQQYSTTKELLPRSAADIVEVQVQHNDYDLTVTLNDNVSAIFVYDTEDENTPLITDGEAGTVQVTDGTQIKVSPDVASGYDLESLTVNGVDVTSQMDNSGAYTFNMPTHAVSITATATASSVTPATSGKYVKVTSNEDLTDGQYLIVYEEGSLAFDGSLGTLDAANNTISVTISDNEIVATTATEAAEFTIDVTNGTILSASGYYIGRTNDTNGMNSSTTEAYTNTLSIDADGNADIVSEGGAYLRYNATSGQDRFRYFKSATYTSQKAIQLYKKVESVTVTSAGYAAIVTQNNVSFNNSGVTAYIVTATATDEATLTAVDEAPTGTPLIVKADAAGTYNLTVKNVVTEDVTGNLLQASNGTVEGDGSTIFALGNKDGVGFYVVANGVTVPDGKPYLVIGGGNGVKGFLAFNFGTPTAISNLEAQKAERGTIYNLAGQRVNKAVKGIFIQNGKKIVVK